MMFKYRRMGESMIKGGILGVNFQKVYKKGYYHGLKYLTMIAA